MRALIAAGAGPRRQGVAARPKGRDRAGALHAPRAAARAPGSARRRGATGHPGSGGDRPPLRGRCWAVSAEHAAVDAASTRSPARRSGDGGAGSPVPPRAPAGDRVPEHPRDPSHRVAPRVGTALEAEGAGGPEASSGWWRSVRTGPRRRQGPGRAVPDGGRRLGAAACMQRGRDPALSAGARRARATASGRDGAAHGQRAHGRPARPDRTAGAALGEYEIVEAGYRAAGTRQPGRGSFARWGSPLGRARGRGAPVLRGRARPARRHREHIERAHLYQEMGRLAFRSGDSQRAVEWAEQARLRAERLAADPCSTRTGARKR